MNRAAMWLASAVGLAVCAATVVSLTLFALAIGLVVVVASAALTVTLAARRVTVTRSLAEREVREDEPLRLAFGVHGLGALPVRLEVLAGDETGEEAWVPLEDFGAMPFVIGRRGAYRLEPTLLRLIDIFGIFRRTVLAGEPEPVLVLPMPDTGAHIAVPPGAPAEDLDPDGLRPYVPGSPIGRIHWASLARGGELHERRFANPPAGLPLVIVETVGAEDPAEVDWVARAAAGCVLRLSRAGGCKVLLPGDEVVTEVGDAGARHAVYRRLAVLESAAPGSVSRSLGAGPTSVVRFPAGLVVPPPPPLPPGVVPMPAGFLQYADGEDGWDHPGHGESPPGGFPDGGSVPERPVVEEPVVEEPVVKEPVVKEPVVKKSAVKAVGEGPVREGPVREGPVREGPVRERLSRDPPVRERPVGEWSARRGRAS